MDSGAWPTTVHGHKESQTWMNWLMLGVFQHEFSIHLQEGSYNKTNIWMTKSPSNHWHQKHIIIHYPSSEHITLLCALGWTRSDLTSVKFLNIMFYCFIAYASPKSWYIPSLNFLFSSVALLMQLLPPRQSPSPLYLFIFYASQKVQGRLLSIKIFTIFQLTSFLQNVSHSFPLSSLCI